MFSAMSGRNYRTGDGKIYPLHATHQGEAYFLRDGRRRYVRAGGGGRYAREREALTSVYIPHLVKGILGARTMSELTHGLASLWLLARLNKCLYDLAVKSLAPTITPYTEELQRVSRQTTTSHAGIEFLGYLSGRHNLHDEIRLEAQFVMSDGVRVFTNSVLDTNDYALISLRIRTTKGSHPIVEYTLNRSRNIYEYQQNNVTLPDQGAPVRLMTTKSDTLLGRLLRSHRVITAHLFPLVEHIYSRRIAENPASVANLITRGAVMRVDNFVSTEILEEEHVFFR